MSANPSFYLTYPLIIVNNLPEKRAHHLVFNPFYKIHHALYALINVIQMTTYYFLIKDYQKK